MPLLAVSSNKIVVAKGVYVDYYDYSKHNIIKITSETANTEENITDIVLSLDGNLLAVLCSKTIMVYDLPHFNNTKQFALPRSGSKIRFGVNNSNIFVADKTGDVLNFQLSEGSGSKLLGHLSLLLNVLQTNDGKYIITSDRDEKIKVSSYPNTYNIQTYCLGHREFVNHIELYPNRDGYLTSASGDGTIKFWSYLSGSLLYTIDTYMDLKNKDDIKLEFSRLMDEEGLEINSLPIVDFTITSIDDDSSLIAVVVHSYMKILIYQVSFNKKQLSHSLVKDISILNVATAIKFQDLKLLVYDAMESIVQEYQVETNDNKILVNLYQTIKVFENMELESSAHNHSSIKLLFKRKFDNVQEYQERKKQRIEKCND